MSNSQYAMDVDSPVSLRRSSSAPMINELNNTTITPAATTTSTRDSLAFNIFSNGQPRVRRFSASFSPIHNGGVPRCTPRVNQLRQEECVDLVVREVQHERELHSAMQMSQSWEDLTLVPGSSSSSSSCKSEPADSGKERRLMEKVMNPLHLSLPSCPPLCSSPSPTRSSLGRQRFSPVMQMWKSSTSPSPTRRTFSTRRSSSPIAMRPSCLGPVKRKFELEEEKGDQYLSPPAKRANCFIGDSRGGLLMAHSTTLDTSSPIAGSSSSVGTPESLSSADSPGFAFRPGDSPSPGRPTPAVMDEPMQEEIRLDTKQRDEAMTSIEECSG